MTSAINEISISYYKLTKTERILAKKIIQKPIVIVNNSIASAAESYGVSVASIQRLAKKIGYSGYSEFRFSLANELKNTQSNSSNDSNPMSQIVNGYQQHIELLRQEKYYASARQIKELILGANNLYIVGLGGSFYVAGYLEHMLFYGTRAAHVINEQERFDYLDGIVTQGDVVLIFSVSGAESILKQYEDDSFKSKGVKLVLITMNEDTIVSSVIDYLVVLPRVPLVIKEAQKSEIFIDNNSVYMMFIHIILFILQVENVNKSST
ncbi:MurR/RpiR family transcriptional regulator [Yersinia mollaretii]|uniref:MurR/RpiR family transcriptional regulator n=1 Tax=Yersinia mollaretii TaxID=33060 RepID=UPI0005E4A62E|nr:MurR/RpiR family transcriptional regulator [Yersinia mollaretii]MDA5527344.1 MurR/RpiR family transcriptional regulator [Yersinia mollaretii]MDA5533656.1 MurR/RpiR family transcriptional regulator [Yersinia mollaretii]MDR7874670.1 MurR/RpiR family transcriptional regulator [Yersinia mollaretii]NIL01589.1 MurR/RpiR family transcriptional regulator [Yersinia mollaretii]PHZ31519.1 MurR/RpiR family transcriptional regulator [Yersinia mollaretii]